MRSWERPNRNAHRHGDPAARDSLFRQLGLAELYLIAGIGIEAFVPQGTTLGVEGEPLPEVWVILEGRVAVNSPVTGTAESLIEAPAVLGVSALVEPYTSFGTGVADTAAASCASRPSTCGSARRAILDSASGSTRSSPRGCSSARTASSKRRRRAPSAARSDGEDVERGAAGGGRTERPTLRHLRLLSGVPFLSSLSPDELRLIFPLGTERNLPPCTVLGHGGERNDSVWVLLDGQIEVASPITNAVSAITAPQVLGVASLIAPFAPTGTAVTRTECRMLQLQATDVRRLAEQDPRLGSRIYQRLATHVFRRLRDLTNVARRRAS